MKAILLVYIYFLYIYNMTQEANTIFSQSSLGKKMMQHDAKWNNNKAQLYLYAHIFPICGFWPVVFWIGIRRVRMWLIGFRILAKARSDPGISILYIYIYRFIYLQIYTWEFGRANYTIYLYSMKLPTSAALLICVYIYMRIYLCIYIYICMYIYIYIRHLAPHSPATGGSTKRASTHGAPTSPRAGQLGAGARRGNHGVRKKRLIVCTLYIHCKYIYKYIYR